MLIVHHLNNSRSQRVLWLLEELGVPYEIKHYQRGPDMLAPKELRSVHSLGKSPVITDNGNTVAESGAIIEYIVENYGNGRLIPPPKTTDRLRYTYWLHYAEGSAMSPLLMNSMRGGQPIPGHGIDPRARFWTMAGSASSGHDGPALFSAKRGRTVVLSLPNRTAFPHAMHLHGHHFRLLDRLDDGWKPFWLDTLVVGEQVERIAFVADNPGKWLIQAWRLEQPDAGLAAWFAVT